MISNVVRRSLPLAMTASMLRCSKSLCEDNERGAYANATKLPVTKDMLKENQKIIHLVRHAKGAHNAAAEFDYGAYKREDLEDAWLTEEGIDQCGELFFEAATLAESVELVIVSPLNRTIQTAVFSFPYLLEKVQWIARPEVRETMGQHPCDRMMPVSRKVTLYPDINFDALGKQDRDHEYYEYHNTRESVEQITQRGVRFIEWLKTRPEKEIIVVTHSGFLLSFVNNVLQDRMLEFEENVEKEFRNAELRSFVISID